MVKIQPVCNSSACSLDYNCNNAFANKNAWLCLPRCCKAICVYVMTWSISSDRSLRLTPYWDNNGSARSTYLKLGFVGLTRQKQYRWCARPASHHSTSFNAQPAIGLDLINWSFLSSSSLSHSLSTCSTWCLWVRKFGPPVPWQYTDVSRNLDTVQQCTKIAWASGKEQIGTPSTFTDTLTCRSWEYKQLQALSKSHVRLFALHIGQCLCI